MMSTYIVSPFAKLTTTAPHPKPGFIQVCDRLVGLNRGGQHTFHGEGQTITILSLWPGGLCCSYSRLWSWSQSGQRQYCM